MTDKKKKSANTLMPSSPAVWVGVDKDYRAEDDHRTMTRAGEIKADRERLKGVKDHHKKMQKHMEKACK
jgi:hypothetical protein